MAEHNFITLPEEMWLEIISYLPLSDLREIRLVSKDFKGLVDRKFMNNVKLTINENNIKAIKENFGNRKNDKLSVKYVEFKKVSCKADVQFILQALGDQVEYLSLHHSAIFENLAKYVKNLKTLELCLIKDDMNYLKIGEFTALEEFKFINRFLWHPIIMYEFLNKLLEGPGKNVRLKRLNIYCTPKYKNDIFNLLMLHSATLEFLQIQLPDLEQNFNLWKKVFSSLKNLKTLNISSSSSVLNMVLTNLPQGVQLENIQFRSLDNDQIMVTLIADRWMKSLKDLGLLGCNITDDDMRAFQNMSKLRYLNFESCHHISGNGLLNGFAAEHNTIIEELHLIFLPKFNELDLYTISKRLAHLRVLKITGLSKAVTNNSLAHIFRNQTRLRVLSLEWSCDNITDAALIGFGNSPSPINRLRGLEKLVLIGKLNISDRTLIEGFKFAELRVLELKFCDRITTEGILSLVNTCPAIEVLKIFGKNMTDYNALLAIKTGLKRLRFCRI